MNLEEYGSYWVELRNKTLGTICLGFGFGVVFPLSSKEEHRPIKLTELHDIIPAKVVAFWIHQRSILRYALPDTPGGLDSSTKESACLKKLFHDLKRTG